MDNLCRYCKKTADCYLCDDCDILFDNKKIFMCEECRFYFGKDDIYKCINCEDLHCKNCLFICPDCGKQDSCSFCCSLFNVCDDCVGIMYK